VPSLVEAVNLECDTCSQVVRGVTGRLVWILRNNKDFFHAADSPLINLCVNVPLYLPEHITY
jgi:hypothetical protein